MHPPPAHASLTKVHPCNPRPPWFPFGRHAKEAIDEFYREHGWDERIAKALPPDLSGAIDELESFGWNLPFDPTTPKATIAH